VCPHNKTKTAETKIAKLGTGIVIPRPPTNIRSKVKVRVRRRELCTSIECSSSCSGILVKCSSELNTVVSTIETASFTVNVVSCYHISCLSITNSIKYSTKGLLRFWIFWESMGGLETVYHQHQNYRPSHFDASCSNANKKDGYRQRNVRQFLQSA